jgi:hypothetical protein
MRLRPFSNPTHRSQPPGRNRSHREALDKPKDEIFASTIASGKVPPNDFVGYRKEMLVWTIRTLNPWLFANAAHPFVCAGRRVPALSGLAVLKAARVGVFSPQEEGPKQRNLFLRRRMIGQRTYDGTI